MEASSQPPPPDASSFITAMPYAVPAVGVFIASFIVERIAAIFQLAIISLATAAILEVPKYIYEKMRVASNRGFWSMIVNMFTDVVTAIAKVWTAVPMWLLIRSGVFTFVYFIGRIIKQFVRKKLSSGEVAEPDQSGQAQEHGEAGEGGGWQWPWSNWKWPWSKDDEVPAPVDVRAAEAERRRQEQLERDPRYADPDFDGLGQTYTPAPQA